MLQEVDVGECCAQADFVTVLVNYIHKNPQEILLINNVMNVKETRLILECVDYCVAIT